MQIEDTHVSSADTVLDSLQETISDQYITKAVDGSKDITSKIDYLENQSLQNNTIINDLTFF